MNYTELLREFKENGIYLKRSGANHDIYTNGKVDIAVPRHGRKEIPKGTLNAIRKGFGLK